MASTSETDQERARAAEEQNQKAQEEARAKIKDDARKLKEANENLVEAQSRNQIGHPTTFEEAAKATEEREQPPQSEASLEWQREHADDEEGNPPAATASELPPATTMPAPMPNPTASEPAHPSKPTKPVP